MVYSPLGYSAVLAIFAEGSRGESREEIATALHFPKDVNAVRLAYQSVIGNLYVSDIDLIKSFISLNRPVPSQVKKQSNTPEFKNWFYIYKNYTIENDLKEILQKYYLTEVKSVDRPDDYVHKKDEVEKSHPSQEDSKMGENEKNAEEADNEKDEVMIAVQRSEDEGITTYQRDHISGMTDSSLKIKADGKFYTQDEGFRKRAVFNSTFLQVLSHR